MSSTDTIRVAPRLIVGLSILSFGMLWMLDNLNLFDANEVVRWWPVVLVAIGAVRLLDPARSKTGSVIFIVLGTLLLLDVADLVELDVDDLFPLVIVAVGGKLIYDALDRRGRRARAIGADPNAHISAFALMASVKRQSNAANFQSADANAVMGGVELDLRNAQIPAGEEAVIDTFAWWGGIEIRVPENWRVVSKVMPLMGACEDQTKPTGTGPTLVVRGMAVMAGIEVKN